MHVARRPLANRAAVGVAGTVLLVAGVAGVFLPVLPGVVLIAAGLGVLGREYLWARNALTRLMPSRRSAAPAVDREAA